MRWVFSRPSSYNVRYSRIVNVPNVGGYLERAALRAQREESTRVAPIGLHWISGAGSA